MPRKVSPHFKRKEFACKCGCGLDAVDVELLTALEELHHHFQSEHIDSASTLYVEITSGDRCEAHNSAVGGSSGSQHIFCKAADIKVWLGWREVQIPADEVAAYLEASYQDRYGIGRYDNRTHIDVRPNQARWDKRNQA